MCHHRFTLTDRVIRTPSGRSYERAYIEAAVRQQGLVRILLPSFRLLLTPSQDPLTRERLSMKDLRPNRQLKDAIATWLAEHPR